MRMPPVFQQMAASIHQDSDLIFGSPEAAINAYIDDVNNADLRELDAYLTWLLTNEDRRLSLKNLWRKVNTDWGFRNNKAVIGFFEAIHDRVKMRLTSQA